VAGERNPLTLAALKDGRIKASNEDIAAALTGDYRHELIFILQQELHLYERVVNNLKKKALAFGLELTPISDSTQCVS
ncbi:MAG: hypothetical protein KAF91_12325, partial [Nostoc sp. TH1S01]|nr:hypothetical protein [Nostoc sp. TH1S01]